MGENRESARRGDRVACDRGQRRREILGRCRPSRWLLRCLVLAGGCMACAQPHSRTRARDERAHAPKRAHTAQHTHHTSTKRERTPATYTDERRGTRASRRQGGARRFASARGARPLAFFSRRKCHSNQCLKTKRDASVSGVRGVWTLLTGGCRGWFSHGSHR